MAVYRIRRLFLTLRNNGLRSECKPLLTCIAADRNLVLRARRARLGREPNGGTMKTLGMGIRRDPALLPAELAEERAWHDRGDYRQMPGTPITIVTDDRAAIRSRAVWGGVKFPDGSPFTGSWWGRSTFGNSTLCGTPTVTISLRRWTRIALPPQRSAVVS
jgi:hypothetical protein